MPLAGDRRGHRQAAVPGRTRHADLADRRRGDRDVDGRLRRYTTRTLYRWLRAWHAYGFEGLKSAQRADAGTHKVESEVLELAAALRREAPARSAAQVADILARTRDARVHTRTLQRFFAAEGLDRARLEGRHRAYGRFEATACGDLWTADAWDGPPVGELAGRHAQLFSLLDDHSRLLPSGGFYPDVSEWSFQRCLRKAIARHGYPGCSTLIMPRPWLCRPASPRSCSTGVNFVDLSA